MTSCCKKERPNAGALWTLVLVAACAVATGPLHAQINNRDETDPYATTRPSAQRAAEDSRDASNAQLAVPTTPKRFERETITEGDERTKRDNRDNRDNRGNDLSNDEAEAIRRRAAEVRRPVPLSEFETFVSEVVDRPLRRFGANLLIPGARDFTAPPTTTVPPDYRLNPGDEILIGLSGSVDASDLRLTIDSQGRVFVPRVGAVNLAGVRFGDLQSVLSSQISRQYRNFNLSVGIGRLRGITVYVTGFAAIPGSYTVSSLSTLVNAVLAAGGPSPGGSFRSIQLRRSGKLISDFDLYDLLLRGDKSGDRALQNGDVIYLSPVGPQAAVIGSVNNEAIFEAAPGETVADLLLEAGGVNTVADETRALLLDPLKRDSMGWEELTPAVARTRLVPRAGIIRVLSGVGLTRPLEQQSVLVSISGEVAAPGRYYLPANTRVADVIARAGGMTAGAYPYATVYSRETVRLQQRKSFERAVRDLETSLTLEPLTSALTPATDQQGRLFAARSIIEEIRRVKPDGRLVLDVLSGTSSVPGDLIIENNDAIYIPPRPTTIGVFGAVPNPSSFYITGPARIRDYLSKAGGAQKIAARKDIFVVRANGGVLSPRGGRGNVLSQPALPGDLIYVPINGSRDAIWLRLRELTGLLLPTALVASSVVQAVKKMSEVARWVETPRNRRILYGVLAVVLAVFCIFPQPYVARAKLLPQDSSSAGLGQILSSLGGQLQSFANLLTGGRPPNDLYLIIGRSDIVRTEVVDKLNLAGPSRRYATVEDAKIALSKKVDVRLLLGGVLEIEATTLDPRESQALTSAYAAAISKQIGALGRQTIRRKGEIVEQRFKDANVRVSRTENTLNNFRRANRLASPETQLGTEISLRTTLQGQLQAKLVELQTVQQFAGPENPGLRAVQTEIGTLRAQIARTDRPTLGSAGPNIAGLSEISTRYLNLFRDYRFAQSLYDVYARASEQVAVENLVAESATYIQTVEPAHLDPERHYNILAIGLLAALALFALFTEVYVPMTGLRWPDLFGRTDPDVVAR